MTITEDVEAIKRVDAKVNLYRMDRGTTNIGTFNAVVSTVQEYYREFKRVPTANETLARLPVGSTHKTICKILASEGFEKSMEMRGITLTPTNGLSVEQSLLLTALTDPTDRRPLAAKLKRVGIPYHKYRNWLNNPLFANAVNRQSEELLSVHTGDVLTQLTQKAVGGDLNAIKFYLEVNGRHDPNGAKGPDAQVIVGQVLEIIMRRVTDSATLAAIASDLEMLGAGRRAFEGSPGEAQNLVNSTVVDTEPLMISDSPAPEAVSAQEWLDQNAKYRTPVGVESNLTESDRATLALNFDLPEM